MKGFIVLPHRRERTFFRNPTLKGPSPEGAASRDRGECRIYFVSVIWFTLGPTRSHHDNERTGVEEWLC
jgi:hypothetical protein